MEEEIKQVIAGMHYACRVGCNAYEYSNCSNCPYISMVNSTDDELRAALQKLNPMYDFSQYTTEQLNILRIAIKDTFVN